MPLGSSLFSLRSGAARPGKCVPPHSGLGTAKGRDYSVMTMDLARGLKCRGHALHICVGKFATLAFDNYLPLL